MRQRAARFAAEQQKDMPQPVRRKMAWPGGKVVRPNEAEAYEAFMHRKRDSMTAAQLADVEERIRVARARAAEAGGDGGSGGREGGDGDGDGDGDGSGGGGRGAGGSDEADEEDGGGSAGCSHGQGGEEEGRDQRPEPASYHVHDGDFYADSEEGNCAGSGDGGEREGDGGGEHVEHVMSDGDEGSGAHEGGGSGGGGGGGVWVWFSLSRTTRALVRGLSLTL
jgi:hypothetical protein